MMVSKITFLMWFISLVIWNYCFPEASPWEDVFVGVCLYFFKKALDKHLIK